MISNFIVDILKEANPDLYIGYCFNNSGEASGVNLLIGERRILIKCGLEYKESNSDVTSLCELLKELNSKVKQTVLETERYSSDEVYI